MAKTNINWTNYSWNVVTGCDYKSDGCLNCWAKTMTKRLKGMKSPKYAAGFDKVVCHPEALNEVDKFHSGSWVFINSMSDTFHSDVPYAFFLKIMEKIKDRPALLFQFLTKRPERALDFFNAYQKTNEIPENICFGCTIESPKQVNRLKLLKEIPVETKFISFEPLLGTLPKMDLLGITAAIIGCESGNKRRKIPLSAIEKLVEQCTKQNIQVFIKQIELNGNICEDINQFPTELQIRQFFIKN